MTFEYYHVDTESQYLTMVGSQSFRFPRNQAARNASAPIKPLTKVISCWLLDPRSVSLADLH